MATTAAIRLKVGGLPQQDVGDAEEDRKRRRDSKRLHTRGQPHTDRDKDVDRVLGVIQRGAKPNCGHDACQGKRQSKAGLHDHHGAGDRRR